MVASSLYEVHIWDFAVSLLYMTLSLQETQLRLAYIGNILPDNDTVTKLPAQSQAPGVTFGSLDG